MFFFIHYFFFKHKNTVVAKSFSPLYQKQWQTTQFAIPFENLLYNLSGVVVRPLHKPLIVVDISVLPSGFCVFYPFLFYFFYQQKVFWGQNISSNTPCDISQLPITPFMHNQQQYKPLHTLQALQAGIQKSPKKLSKGAKMGKTHKTPFPLFSSFVGRSAMILPQHVGHVFFVHNGKTYNSVSILPKMLGHKFGEFASTRKKPSHKKKK